MNQEAGGVLIAFLGVVLIIAGINGTLSKTWAALTGKSGSSAPQSGTPIPGSTGAGNLPTLATTTTAGQPGSGVTV